MKHYPNLSGLLSTNFNPEIKNIQMYNMKAISRVPKNRMMSKTECICPRAHSMTHKRIGVQLGPPKIRYRINLLLLLLRWKTEMKDYAQCTLNSIPFESSIS